MPKAFLTGIAGQDGSYLGELLLSKGYEVHGLVHPETTPSKTWLEALSPQQRTAVHTYTGSLTDSEGLTRLIAQILPDEVYNLAAQSDDQVSMREPELTAEINAMGPVRLLEAIRRSGHPTRFLQASSAQLFGEALTSPQNEDTPFRPQSPYGYAKAFAHWMTVHYRIHHGLYAVNAILYNHESPRRTEAFVTRKITRAVALIKSGKLDKLVLGSLDTKRDWTFAGDTVRAMWLALQAEKPEDYVVGSGESHTVREFVEEAFAYSGLDWVKYVVTDENLLRKLDIAETRADASKAQTVLGWKPSVDFKGLIHLMVDSDMAHEA